VALALLATALVAAAAMGSESSQLLALLSVGAQTQKLPVSLLVLARWQRPCTALSTRVHLLCCC
jgi:hypothetical protein